jgi:hypothetical protein
MEADVSAFMRARHWSLSGAQRIHSTNSHPLFCKISLNVILSYIYVQVLQVAPSPQFFFTKLCLFLISALHATCPVYLSLRDFTIIIIIIIIIILLKSTNYETHCELFCLLDLLNAELYFHFQFRGEFYFFPRP